MSRGLSSFCRREEHRTCRMAQAICLCDCHGAAGQEPKTVTAARQRLERPACPECGSKVCGKLAADDPRHGTVNGYVNCGCRCEECCEANTARVRAYRRSRGMEPRRKRGRTHGIRTTYTHGCRCDECRRAEAEYRKAYRRRQAAS